MKPIHVLAALAAVLFALFAVPTLATETPDLSTCRVPCPEQYARCTQRCAVPQDDTCELKCNQAEGTCSRTRPAETCAKEADACRRRCAAGYGPDPLPW